MISDAFFNESLSALKKNGALFFEAYCDETVTAFTDMMAGKAYPEKSETTRGVSLRAFDGEKLLFATTEDLSEDNLRGIVRKMAEQLSPANNKQPMPLSGAGDSIKETGGAHDWTPHREPILRNLLAEQQSVQAAAGDGITVKTRCYFMDRKIRLLSSLNGTVHDRQSVCCVVTEAGNADARVTNVLSPVSPDDLDRLLRTKGLVTVCRDSGQEPAPCPTGTFDLVLLSGSSSLFFHECCGHPLEIYNAMRPDAVFHGKIGQKIAAGCVSLCDDGSLEGLWGSLTADDEGTPAQRNVLIRDGVLQGYLTDIAEGYRHGLAPTGSARRQYYKKAPAARMTNTFLMKGTDREEDIIRDTKKGLLIRSFSFGNVNPVTGDFTVRITSGNFIRNGNIEEPFRGGTIRAGAADVLTRIDRVADNLSFTNGFCLSVSGRITVSGGQPTVRITGVPVFGGE